MVAEDVSIVPGTIAPLFFFLFLTPCDGRSHCATSGGMQRSWCRLLARYQAVWVLLGAARYSDVDRGYSCGGSRVVLVAVMAAIQIAYILAGGWLRPK